MTNFPRYISPVQTLNFRAGASQPCLNQAAAGDVGQHLVLAQLPQKAQRFWGAGAAPHTPRAGTGLNILPHLRKCAVPFLQEMANLARGSPRSAMGNAFPPFPDLSVEKSCFNLGDFPGAGDSLQWECNHFLLLKSSILQDFY